MSSDVDDKPGRCDVCPQVARLVRHKETRSDPPHCYCHNVPCQYRVVSQRQWH